MLWVILTLLIMLVVFCVLAARYSFGSRSKRGDYYRYTDGGADYRRSEGDDSSGKAKQP